MAAQQPEARVTVDLPVRMWGMSADGRPFSQHARAQNISSEGALLAGIENELKVGDVIGVQCVEKKTSCTVIWVTNTGVVRTCDPGVGNGIEFTGMPIEGKEHLQAYLDGIDPGMGVSAPPPEQ